MKRPLEHSLANTERNVKSGGLALATIVRWARRLWVVELLVLFAALVPRALDLNTFITADEPMWAFRSARFAVALLQGRWADTFLVGHPGVTTMWLGTLGLALGHLAGIGPGPEAWAWLEGTPGLDPQDVDAVRRAAVFLPTAKLLLAPVHALLLLILYRLARQVLGTAVALLGIALILGDPFLLANSRLLHTDALLASWMAISVLALLAYLQPAGELGSREAGEQGQSPLLLLSGVAAGLAALTKSPALFLLPVAVVAIIAQTWHRNAERFVVPTSVTFARASRLKSLLRTRQIILDRRLARQWLHDLAVWLFSAGLVFVILWPATWTHPGGVLAGYLGKATEYAIYPAETSHFFMGTPQEDPGPLFYALALPFRMTPLTTIGVLLALPGLLLGRRNDRRTILALLAYAALFAVFVAFQPKKFDRYLLPIFPILDLVAAWAWLPMTNDHIPNPKFGYWSLGFGIWVLVLLQAVRVWRYQPYFTAYFNPLLGGIQRAVHEVPVGWGEGLDQVAAYLNTSPGNASRNVLVGGVVSLAPLTRAPVEPPTPHGWVNTDLAVVYVGDRQVRSDLARAFEGHSPQYVARIAGLEVAWVYPNPNKAVTDDLMQMAQPDADALLLDLPDSPFLTGLPGRMPVRFVGGRQDEQAVSAGLSELAVGRRRIWYLTYPQVDGDPAGLIHYQLGTRADRIEVRNYPGLRLTNYDLGAGTAFGVTVPTNTFTANFDNQLWLRAYSFDGTPARYGRDLGVSLIWDLPEPVYEDYTAFVHLVDSAGHIWGQGDRLLLNGAFYPTSRWLAGEQNVTRHTISPWPGIPPGRYFVRVGLYRRGGDRLAVLGARATSKGTEVTLGEVEVAPSLIIPSPAELSIRHPTDLALPGQLKLLGYDIDRDVIKSGESLVINLFWQALGLMPDYELQLVLRDATGHPLAGRTLPPAGESFPTSRWVAGQVLRGQYDLDIPATAPPATTRLVVRLIRGNTVAAEWPLAEVQLEAIQRRFGVPPIQTPLHAELGHNITFLGYDLNVLRPAPSGAQSSTVNVQLTLYWQARGPTQRSYTVFVHILDSAGGVIAQRDHPPVSGTRPTTGWVPGEVVADPYEVALPPGIQPGEYAIEIGMYDPTTGERLPVRGTAVAADQGRIVLPTRLDIR